MNYHSTYIEDLRRIREGIPSCGDLAGKTVMVTGATGLIGSAVVDFLAQWNADEGAGIRILAAGRSPERFRSRFGDRAGLPGVCFQYFDAMDPAFPGKEPAQTAFPETSGLLKEAFLSERSGLPARTSIAGSSGPSGEASLAETSGLPEDGALPAHVDHVIHAAGLADPAFYGGRPVETMMTTILGTRKVLELAAARPGCRLLFVSSSEVYGKKERPELFTEDAYGKVDILAPRSCYPVSRRAAETLCVSFAEEYGVDFVIARPGHIYGPTMTQTDSRVSSLFPREVCAGRDLVLKSSGSQRRSYCYVLDCVSALLTILLRGERGTAYNVSNRRSIATIREMAECFAEAAGRKVRYEDPTRKERAAFNPMEDAALDASRLEALGWTGAFDLETGVARTLACLRAGESCGREGRPEGSGTVCRKQAEKMP